MATRRPQVLSTRATVAASPPSRLNSACTWLSRRGVGT